MKNCIEPITIGVLDIIGLYAEREIPEEFQEGIDFGVYHTYHFTLEPNGAPIWQCFKPLTQHGIDIIAETGGKLVCVYSTRNCANNVGGPEVKAFLNCIFDGALN